ncbi:DUF2076 domain-containing protein [Buchnera aphidicola (Muscaphis stroyani)]|uniref:DUF2076 domain-containing protein n=1 Tax=Buchnera aphidicola (Muscaphis stroyani) TaxID=1241869 RepID=A0A4D6YIL8_9GAMM|nr:DUF2076 domain-containing protein [Buchnera aphidicola]QCI24275.1 DUF2076 domain-containing protein [Buchnera aphidicola (Muscaphis stroyani)]
MKDEEKNLIENLFHRLKNTELNSANRDQSADNLIQKLVRKQPFSSYYMTQTILIQEAAIKKMSLKIEELNKKVENNNLEKTKKQPSFLSSFFKNSPSSDLTSHNQNNVWKNKESPLQYHASPVVSAPRSSGFLGNALQTAMGVAGGMVLGNMLMNVFDHSKPEEEIFDTINHSSEHLDENIPIHDSTADSNLVNYESNESAYEESENDQSNSEDMSYINSSEDCIDTNDDNFI